MTGSAVPFAMALARTWRRGRGKRSFCVAFLCFAAKPQRSRNEARSSCRFESTQHRRPPSSTRSSGAPRAMAAARTWGLADLMLNTRPRMPTTPPPPTHKACTYAPHLVALCPAAAGWPHEEDAVADGQQLAQLHDAQHKVVLGGEVGRGGGGGQRQPGSLSTQAGACCSCRAERRGGRGGRAAWGASGRRSLPDPPLATLRPRQCKDEGRPRRTPPRRPGRACGAGRRPGRGR